MARWAGARAQSRPKSTLEGGQSLFGRLGGDKGARRRHLGGGEKGAEAPSLLRSSIASSRLYSSRGSIVGLYGQVDAPASGAKALESLWARAA